MSKTDFAGAVNKQLATLRDGNTYSVAKASKEAGLIGAAANKLDIRYHACAVAALGCVRDHNQATPMADLLNNMGRSARAKALATWFEKYSHVIVTQDKAKKWAVGLVERQERWDATRLADMLLKALDDPFWTPEEKEGRDFSLHQALAALLKKAEAAKARDKLSDEDKLAMIELVALTERTKPVVDTLEKVG